MSLAPRLVGCAMVGITTAWASTWAAAWVEGAESEASARIEPAACVQLTYRAPLECPSHGFVVQRVAAMVQNTPETPIIAKAIITRRGRYVLWLDFEGGRREVTSESCSALAETLTVILALAIDPQARVAPSTPTTLAPLASTELPSAASASASDGASSSNAPSASAATSSAPASSAMPVSSAAASGAAPNSAEPTPAVAASKVAPVSTAASAPSAASSANAPAVSAPPEPELPTPEAVEDVVATDKPEEESGRFRFTPAALFWTEYGMLPKVSFGPNLALWMDRGRWSYSVTAEWLAPQWTSLSPQQGSSISFLGGKGLACIHPSLRARLLVCLGAEAGDLMGEGKGGRASKLGHGLWLSGVGALIWRPRLWSKLGAEVRTEMAFPVVWPEFGFSGNDWRFEPERWSLRVAGGFSWLL